MLDSIKNHINSLKKSDNKHCFYRNVGLAYEEVRCDKLPVLLAQIKSNVETQKYTNACKQQSLTVLSNFTVDNIIDYVQLAGLSYGINLTVNYPGYNQYAFEVSNDASEFYQNNTDYTLLLIDETAIFDNYCIKADAIKKLGDFSDYYLGLLSKLRDQTTTKIIISNLCLSKGFLYSYLDYESRIQIMLAQNHFNQKLLEFSLANNDVFIIDVNILLQDQTVTVLRDERLALFAKMQFSDEVLKLLALEVSQIVSANIGLSKKCIALDLDNNLWGGILGDDGPNGIDIGESIAGNEFKQLQKLLKHLKNQGILLTINSKNDEENVNTVFTKNDEMILKHEDFISIYANWQAKHENIRNITKEINIAIDSVFFIDDSEVECSLVRSFLPETHVFCSHGDPLSVVNELISKGYFNKTKSSDEDHNRTTMYRVERDRNTFISSISSLENFLEHLNIQVNIFHVSENDFPRIGQLCQRTNQFNLTTKRYSENEIQQFTTNNGCFLLAVKVTDKFGPYGLVGAVFLKTDGNKLVIDNFLLSCRVFSRGIEDALLVKIIQIANDNKISTIQGLFIPNEKNRHVKEFYQSKGFEFIETQNDMSIFQCVTENVPKYPSWLTVTNNRSDLSEGNIHAS